MSTITFCAACGESIPSRDAGRWTLENGQGICQSCHEALVVKRRRSEAGITRQAKQPLPRWLIPTTATTGIVLLAVAFLVFGSSDAATQPDARPLKEELPATEALLDELERLSARTSVGISFREYPGLLSPVAFQAKRWAQSDEKERTPSQVRALLAEALDDYQFIHDAWRWHVLPLEDLRFDLSYITLFGKARIQRYKDGLSGLLPMGEIDGGADAKTYAEDFVRVAMKHASRQVDEIRRLMNVPRSTRPAK